jgi:integration host factor subunit beta
MPLEEYHREVTAAIRSHDTTMNLGREGKPDNMTKAELVEEVSRVVKITRNEAEMVIEAILGRMVRAVRDGNKVEVRGFGSFRTRERKPRLGRNPKTGVSVDIPAKRIPYFKPSKELKDLVNATSTGKQSAPPKL